MIDLTAARVMDPERVTPYEGHWYLRSLITDEYHVQLCSACAPAGTVARDLVPGDLIVGGELEDDELALPAADLAKFLQWPPR